MSNQFDEYLGKLEGEEYREALKYLTQHCPGSTWEITRFPDSKGRFILPYLKSDAGYFVEMSITVNDVKRSQLLPVRGENGEVILNGASSLDIQIALEYCFLVCVALHGLDPYRKTPNVSTSTTDKSHMTVETPSQASNSMEQPTHHPVDSHLPQTNEDVLYRILDLEVVVDDEQQGTFHYLLNALYKDERIQVHATTDFESFFQQPISDRDLFRIDTVNINSRNYGPVLMATNIERAS